MKIESQKMIYTENYTDEIKNIIKHGCLPEYHNVSSNVHKMFKDKIGNKCSNHNVPKKIHLSWIGSSLPQKYVPYVESFVTHNADSYEINLWLTHETNIKFSNVVIRNVNDFNFVHKEKILNDATKNYSRSNDILSYEIVYMLGGIYCDIDTRCIKGFDENFDKSLVTYIEHSYKNLQHSFFAFPQNSEFLKYAIDCIDFCYDIPYPNSTGPAFITTCCYVFDDRNIKFIKQRYLGQDTSDRNSAIYLIHDYHATWTK